MASGLRVCRGYGNILSKPFPKPILQALLPTLLECHEESAEVLSALVLVEWEPMVPNKAST